MSINQGPRDEISPHAEIDDLLFELHRKMIVREMKKKLSNQNEKKAKVAMKTDASFSRFSSKYFSKVLSSLSPDQKRTIEYYVIPVSKESVSVILGLPLGGLEFCKDHDVGKQFILSKYGKNMLPSVRFFGDKFIRREVMSKDKSSSFRAKLDCGVGTMLPDNFKEKLCSIVFSHSSTNHVSNSKFCEDVVISVLRLLCEESSSRNADQNNENIAGGQNLSCGAIQNEKEGIVYDIHSNDDNDGILSGERNRSSAAAALRNNSPDVEYLVLDHEKRYFVAICRLADNTKWHSYDAVDINNVKAKFSSFGHSLMKGGHVLSYVMFVFCRVLFHKSHPSKSKRQYFFSSIGELLLTDLTCADSEKIKRSFVGAASARKLHLYDMLYFPILHHEHSFFFIVDIKDIMLVFVDSLNEKMNNFHTVWDSYEGSSIDFCSFKRVYPSVPKQSYWYI
uniref:Ubiquitin-like protease family profile domain-containing protein n=1 Tax=Oryza punctata TaxID=4537 RepID=A0A0E0KF81_ORYPU